MRGENSTVSLSPTSRLLALRTAALRAMKCVPSPMGSSDVSKVDSPTVARMATRPRSARPSSSSVIHSGMRT